MAQALVPALTAVDFCCQVIEDREEFCRPELFPSVERTHLLQSQDFEQALSIGSEDYVCIMTRSHKDDTVCEAFALRTPARGILSSQMLVFSKWPAPLSRGALPVESAEVPPSGPPNR